MGDVPRPNSPSHQSAAGSAPRGTRVGAYELEEVLGDRGTGTVYRGRQVATNKQVAIKVLHSRRQDVIDELVRGARAVSRVHHTNLVDMIEVGATRDGTVFLAMELLTGESLQERLQRVGPLPLFDAINIVRQVAHGLAAAHATGLIHGGLEPAKIFLCRRDGRRRVVRRNKAMGMKLVVEPEGRFDLVKLLDLGLKRFFDLASNQSDLHESARYWSPEQAQRRTVDLRSDIYSLGAVFYEMITGTVPFDGASLAEVLRHHVSGMVTAPSQRAPTLGIDGLVDWVVLRCLHKTPSQRFADTDELCEALDGCVADCAFLRDAHRLPGIEESGIDLPEARSKPRKVPELPSETTPRGSPPRKNETSAPQPGPSKTGPKAWAVPPAPSAAKAATKPELPAAAKVAPPPMPVPGALKAPLAGSAPPPVPASSLAPAARAIAVAPAAVESPAERPPTNPTTPPTNPTTPPPISLSSDLLSEIADEPAVVEATTAIAKAIVDGVTAPSEPDAPAALAEAPAARKDTEPGAPDAPAALAEAPAARKDTEPMAPDAPAALAEAPAARKDTEPMAPDVPAANVEAEGVPPIPASSTAAKTLASKVVEHGDRVDGDDDVDDLLRATWEGWRRPKLMALAGAALIGALGFGVWAGRSKSTPAASAPVAGKAPAASAPVADKAPAPSAPVSNSSPALPPAPLPQAPPPSQAPAPPAPTVSAAPTEPVQPSEAAPRGVAAVASETKPDSSKPRPVSVAAKETVPAATEEAMAPVPSIAPRQATAPTNVPPRLAGAWPHAPRTAPVSATPGSATKPPSRSTEQARASATKVPPTASANPEQLIREAQQAWLSGQHTQAVGRAQAVLAASPKPAQMVQAYEILATCSCALRKRDRALEAASHLDSARREAVKAVCAKNGVPFE